MLYNGRPGQAAAAPAAAAPATNGAGEAPYKGKSLIRGNPL